VLLAFPTFIHVFLNPFSTFTHTSNPRLNLSARCAAHLSARRAADSPLSVQALILPSESFRFNKRLGVVMNDSVSSQVPARRLESPANTCHPIFRTKGQKSPQGDQPPCSGRARRSGPAGADLPPLTERTQRIRKGIMRESRWPLCPLWPSYAGHHLRIQEFFSVRPHRPHLNDLPPLLYWHSEKRLAQR